MLNFNGSTKRRVVNLGENRGGNKNRSFLEQAKKDRQEREASREREKRIVLIQSHVRRLLDLRRAAIELHQVWDTEGLLYDTSRWCAEVAFITRFGPASLLGSIYSSVTTAICRSKELFSTEDVASLAQTLNFGLSRRFSWEAALKCLLLLSSRYDIALSPGGALKSMIKNVSRCATSENSSEIVKLIFEINSNDSPNAFVEFLADAPRSLLSASSKYSDIASKCLANVAAMASITQLPDIKKVNLLLSLLTLGPTQSLVQSHYIHARILSTIETPLIPGDKDYSYASASQILVSEADFKALSNFHSSTFVRSAFTYLRESDSLLCVKLLSQLVRLFPHSRTSICMVMSITPELSKWLFHAMTQIVQFQAHLSGVWNAQHSYLKAVDAESDHECVFEQLVYAYNHILSSWLVVSKDTESFTNANFSLVDIKKYCYFLKSFCFNLIKHSRAYSNELKDISVSVLNQLYIKNIRLQFLPPLMWIIDGLKLLSQNIILEPEENDAESSDDENLSESIASKYSIKQKIAPGLESQRAFELEILHNVPFFVDFTTRVQIFQNSIKVDKDKYGADSTFSFFSEDVNSHKLSADIRREFVLQDAFESFFKSGDNFKNPLKVTFHNKHGPEAGIDGGGLTKEFLTSVVGEGFSSDNKFCLFKESPSYNLYPNDDIFWKLAEKIDIHSQRERLMYTKFLGMIVGKCLYEGILIDVSFVPSFLAKWRAAHKNASTSIDDLVFLDPELYANLNKILDMDDHQLQDLDLNFTINEVIENKTYLYDLSPPNGAHEAVTQQNRLSYIHKVSNFKLNLSLRLQTNFFLEGLFHLIKPNWLNMFDPLEMQMLISGGHDIDMADWISNVQYGGYFDDDKTIKLFWEVVEEMTSHERCDLVKFVTSVSRAPLLGFGAMYPKFGISNGGSPNRLPTASTCLNLLKLPDYKDKALIRQKLLYSIYANSGFDLS